MNIGKGKIQIGKEALLGKMPLQQHVLKKLMVMYRCKLFVLKLNIERQEILRKRKIEYNRRKVVCLLWKN